MTKVFCHSGPAGWRGGLHHERKPPKGHQKRPQGPQWRNLSERQNGEKDDATARRRTNARTGSPLEDLSDRELEVFNLIGQGKGTRQIAEELHLSIKTVESHRAHIKEKLGLKSATELVQHAIQWRDAEASGAS
jgi:DNA-binding CsgD family transcriptional regulator